MAILQIPIASLSVIPSIMMLLLMGMSPVHGRDLSSAFQTGSAEIVDGDGLRLHGIPIRLHGIDAPEREQTCRDASGSQWPCGTVATNRLAMLVQDHSVTCSEVERDRYNRSVARCEAAGVDLAEAMVSDGLAWAYLRYSSAYAPAEAAARHRGIGIWSVENQPAWEYRAARRAGTADTAACRIKGNISTSGERIYHLPDSRSYAATRISEAKGERWFCSEEEARTAGWRAPRG